MITIMPMPIVSLTKKEVQENPYCVWNAFVELIGREFAELSVEQRPAHLVFLYESEVQNGGHLQYFENFRAEHLDETIGALGLLGAACQQQVLREAGTLFLSHSREQIDSVEEYVSTALQDEFGEYDQRFYDCSPSLQECLERYLEENQSMFVRIS